jgi:hypothetical protein
MEWNFNPGSVAAWGLGGAAVGAGARLAKYIADVGRDRDISSAVDVKKQVAPVAEIPTEVTEEEAAELKRQGIPVKEASSLGDVAAGAGLGALGTLGIYGGWKALDSTFDKQRKSEAKKRLSRARQRVERLLNSTPEQQDIKIAAAMHAAEEVFFEKKAEVANAIVSGAANAIAYPFTYVAPGLGAIATLAAVAGYNRAKENNKNTQKAKALRNQFVDNRKIDTPVATLVPVLKRKKDVGASPAQQAAEA